MTRNKTKTKQGKKADTNGAGAPKEPTVLVRDIPRVLDVKRYGNVLAIHVSTPIACDVVESLEMCLHRRPDAGDFMRAVDKAMEE